MNKNDAIGILYPVQVTEEQLPAIEVGKYYLIDGDCMECIKADHGVYVFHGSGFAGRELNAKFKWARTALLEAVPAFDWEVRDMLEKREATMNAAASYFERFGTANE